MRKLLAFLACAIALTGAAHAADAPVEATPRLSLEALRAKYADPAGHLVNLSGVDIYYKDEGSGPPILMVHGSVSSLHTFDGVADKLIRHYRIIRYDVAAQGLSGPVSDDAAARLRPADIAEQLLQKLSVHQATVVGVSSGGTLGVFLAAKRPDLVSRLILSNTPSDPVDTSHLKPDPAFDEAQKIAKETGFQSQHFWDEFLSYFSGDPARMTPQIRQQYYDFNRRIPEKNVISLVAQVADHQKAVEAMAAVTAPTLLVWGAKDPLLTPPTADTLGGYLTHAQVSKLFLPDVGHYPPLEAPERFAAIIAAYIEAVTPILPTPTAGATR